MVRRTRKPSQGVASRSPLRPHDETGAGNARNGRHDAGTSPSGRQGENARLPAPSDAVGSAPGLP